ncbi:MAG TPA: hypothetical protein VKW70_09830 [Terriglobia bacterium]|nr:hypothetical protein [Terriglobia bacterium]
MRLIARLAVISTILALLAPSFTCATMPMTPQQTYDCCRSMNFKCHQQRNRDHRDNCCQHKATGPALRSFIPSPRINVAAHLAVVAQAPHVSIAPGYLQHPDIVQFSVAEAHAPPPVPLFLLHSTFLI